MTDRIIARIKAKAEAANLTFAEQMEHEVHNVPLGKYATPDVAAKAIRGLLSEFSDHITGANIVCDGGFIRSY